MFGKLRLAAPLLLLTAALALVWLSPATSSSSCDLYASPAGNDADAGSFQQPYRTVAQLVSKLSAAQPTGCLRGYPKGGPASKSGLHELTAPLSISKPGIALRSADGEVAQLKGPIAIESDDVTLTGLVLDSRLSAAKLASPAIDGHRAKLIDNDITSRGGPNCVTVREGAQSVEIRHNRIHNCANGIRLDTTGATVVEANLVYRNSAAGLLMRPDANDTDVVRNIFDRNADNVVISSSATSGAYADGNSVHQNILSNPERFNLTDGGTPMGELNTFRSNCVYKAGDASNGIDDVTSSSPVPGKALASENTFGNPQYVATRGPSAYQLQPGGPCGTLSGVQVDFGAAAQDDARPSQVEAVNLRPNVVFIVTDDQRADTMHMTPHVMPHTLKWFRDGDPAAGVVGGTEYVNAFATTPLCCPARASIFSGRYSHNHGVITNLLGSRLLSTGTVQRYLNDIGYHNGIFGKYLNGWKAPDDLCGFCKNWHDDAPSAGPAPNFRQWGILEGYHATNINVSPDVTPPGATEYTTDYIFDRAQDFVQGREGPTDGKPWFLYLAPQAPHESAGEFQKYGPDAWKRMLENDRLGVDENTPVPTYTQPVEGDDAATKPRYVREWGLPPPSTFLDNKVIFEAPDLPGLQKQQLRTLLPVDDGINRLFNLLEDSGEADDTLAVFMSDNGYQWREHAAIGGDCSTTGQPGRGTPCGISGKAKPYLDSVKVPFYVRWPGNPDVGANPTETKMVTGLDPAVSVMDVVDARPSGAVDQPVMDGWSLFGFWQRPYVFIEQLAGEAGHIPGFRALRTNSELFVRYFDDPITPAADPGFQEYYDLASDPGEHRNLLGANGERDAGEPSLGALPAMLDIYKDCAGQFGIPESGKFPCP